MAIAHSKKKTTAIISKTGISVSTCYCRKCMKEKHPKDFFVATDLFLDTNGYFSICKECCNEIFDKIFSVEGSVEKALLKTCRLLNLKYDENAIDATKTHLATMASNGRQTNNFFGLYKAKLVTTQKMAMNDIHGGTDLTFQEPTSPIFVSEDDKIFLEDHQDLEDFWGNNLKEEDYRFLERELSEWQKTHKCDTKAEKTLFREICLTTLEIRKKRTLDQPTGKLVEDLQKIMKTAGVDPSQSSAAGSGKSQDTFSAFIKTIEETEPAEYFKDKELFKDFDNIDFYFKKYITRPLKNFITQSRDFNVENEDTDDVDDVEFLSEGEGSNDEYLTSTLQE
jgi:hypothetical protein